MEKREGKLVFVECTAGENARIERDGGRCGMYACVPTDVKGVYRKPFLISETEKIEKNWKGWAYKEDVVGKIFKHFYTENTWYDDAKIVLALNEEFSNDDLIKIRDGKVKEGDTITIEAFHSDEEPRRRT